MLLLIVSGSANGLGKEGRVVLKLPFTLVVLLGCIIYPAVGDKMKSLIIVEFIIFCELFIDELLPLIIYVVSKNGFIKAVSLMIV